MLDSDSGHATSGSAGRGSVDPRPSGFLLCGCRPSTPPGCQQGGPPVRAGGPTPVTGGPGEPEQSRLPSPNNRGGFACKKTGTSQPPRKKAPARSQ